MAMIKCPECGKGVSSDAGSCPNCGNPIKAKSGPFGGFEPGVTVRPGFWHDPKVGCVGGLVVLLVVLFLLLRGWR
jgi:hypothetical protein